MERKNWKESGLDAPNATDVVSLALGLPALHVGVLGASNSKARNSNRSIVT
jgi:hypothetical protein